MAQTWWIGFVAVAAGWVVTESGRQPWIVYGLMRTADAALAGPGSTVATSLALFVVVYGIVFSIGIYYINRLIAKGPEGAFAPNCRRGSSPPAIGFRAEVGMAWTSR